MPTTTLSTGQQSQTLKFDARLKLNITGLQVEKSAHYRINAISIDEPINDLSIKVKDFDGFKFWLSWLFKPRFRQAQYFCLCGSIGSDESCLFAIGQKLTFVPPKNGELFLFINDYMTDFTYANNKGRVTYTLERIL